MIDIVIPNYVTAASLPIVLRCLYSVRQCSPDARLIFVDNASPTLDALLPELAHHKDVVRILNQTNLGFVKAVNQGLRASTADYVVLLNNDTEVVPGWLEKMLAAFIGKVGIVGPRSNPNGTLSCQLPYRTATILPPGQMLVFFCVIISRAVIEKVGLLDEEFGVGLGDDDEYCWRAQQAGFDLCFLGDLTILHHHKTTFNQLFTQAQIRDMGWNAVDIIRRKATGSAIVPEVLRRCPPGSRPH
jgi:GT2 family glycosyltransferase